MSAVRLELTPDRLHYRGIFTADEIETVLAWVRGLGFKPEEVYSTAVIGEGLVEVEHAVDHAAGIWDRKRTVVHNPSLPPYINRFVAVNAQPPPVTPRR